MDEKQPEQFRVVLASVQNLAYPVDIELLHYLFSKYGDVEKIVTFSKTPNAYQALIQYHSPDQAKNALVNLHNRNIYDGCNTLVIQPSRLSEIVVKSNSSKAWDFTISPLGPASTTDGMNGRPAVPGAGAGFMGNHAGISGVAMQPPPPNAIHPGHASQTRGHLAHGQYSMGGNTLLQKILEKAPRDLRDVNLEASNPNQTPVVIVYNLPGNITVQMLFNLFSLYGTVNRIKILREKNDTALIQYGSWVYATIALHLLQGAPVLGRQLQICFSKNNEVKLPPPSSTQTGGGEGQAEEEKRTLAFTPKDQRYGGDDGEKYAKGACRPTKTVFVANIDEIASEDDVKKFFLQHGPVTKFSFRPHKNESLKTQMAIMEMGTEADALSAIMYLHNFEIFGRPMKVAFSKTIL